MTRKITRVRYKLNPCKEPLSQDEINKIIRAADNCCCVVGISPFAFAKS